MESLNNLLANISIDKKVVEQLDTLKLFDNITEKQLNELASSKYVKYKEAGIVLEYLGPLKLSNKINELLVFMQDINWPAASNVASLLNLFGDSIIPHIIPIFEGDDLVWQLWILSCIVQNWNSSSISKIRIELVEIVKKADSEGVAIQALRILKTVLNNVEFTKWYGYLEFKYETNESLLDDLKELLPSASF